MARVEIRQLQGEDVLRVYYPMMDYAFRGSPRERSAQDDQNRLHYLDEHQIYALFENDQPVASATIVPMTQQVRGKIFPMGAVQGVATYPQARRKGYARQMLDYLLKQMRENQQPVSTLYPFRESFYERLGYANFPQSRQAVFAPGAVPSLLIKALPGEVQMMDLKSGYERYVQFLADAQQHQHGIALYPEHFQERSREDNLYWLALAVDQQGEDIGMLLYHITAEKLLRGIEFFYKNSLGKYLILNWLARHVDQTPQIELHLAPGEYAEMWWSDLDARVFTPRERGGFNTPMGRVIMVEGIAGMNVGEGRFTANLHDRQCPWNAGIYRFESRDGKLTVTPAESSAAECELQIQGLSALVYTGADPADFVWRGWGNPSAETQAMMRQMFPPAQPYVLKFF